ncbi:MAG: hypothetical protein H0U75_09895 [Legionella sp.]|nr:hypothetical protein [Legionella sp.]
MSISKINPKLIATIDEKISDMKLKGYRNEDIFISLSERAPVVLFMIESIEPKQLELYTNAYEGFRTYLHKISSSGAMF